MKKLARWMLAKEEIDRPSLEQVLDLPFIKSYIEKFLKED